MRHSEYKEQLKQEFMEQAESVFERMMADRKNGERETLSQIEEKVNEIRFELTSKLVDSKLKLEVEKEQGPSPKCPGCGREMRGKGRKKRQVVTSQGVIEVWRGHHHCPHCGEGLFPPGPTTGDQSPRLE